LRPCPTPSGVSADISTTELRGRARQIPWPHQLCKTLEEVYKKSRNKLKNLFWNAMKPIWFPGFRAAAILLGIFLISGCGLFPPRVELQSVTIDVEPKANNNTPVALDFVAANDAQMLERLKGTPASQWFEQRQQLQRDYPTGFTVWSLEVVPGQFMALKDNPLHSHKADGLLIYARYNTPGAHRLLLDAQNSIWLKIGSREMRLLDAQGQ
jgi:type VI secretion system protein